MDEKTPAPIRRIVQITTSDNGIVAVADDETLWFLPHGTREWQPLPTVPQE